MVTPSLRWRRWSGWRGGRTENVWSSASSCPSWRIGLKPVVGVVVVAFWSCHELDQRNKQLAEAIKRYGVGIGPSLNGESFEQADQGASQITHRERRSDFTAQRLEDAVVVGAGLFDRHRIHRGQTLSDPAVAMALSPNGNCE